MKRLAQGLLLTLVVSICGCKADDSPKVSRFQIMAGKYEIYGLGGVKSSDSVFKIDTLTGKAWIYRSSVSEKELKQGWQEIPEFPK